MKGVHAGQPGSAGSQLLKIIADFSGYLQRRKQTGLHFLPVSQEALSVMDRWHHPRIPAAADVPGEGNLDADIFIIDSDGIFFNGEAGALLLKILDAMTLSREAVFICSIDHMAGVQTIVQQKNPKVIVTLGEPAGQALLETRQPLEGFRGRFSTFCGIKVMPTFHPSLLLKHPEYKRQVWEDMKQVMAYTGLDHGT